MHPSGSGSPRVTRWRSLQAAGVTLCLLPFCEGLACLYSWSSTGSPAPTAHRQATNPRMQISLTHEKKSEAQCMTGAGVSLRRPCQDPLSAAVTFPLPPMLKEWPSFSISLPVFGGTNFVFYPSHSDGQAGSVSCWRVHEYFPHSFSCGLSWVWGGGHVNIFAHEHALCLVLLVQF